MKSLFFLFSFLFLLISGFSLELKYLGKSDEFFCFEKPSKKKLKKNFQGFLFTDIIYNGKRKHAKIAKFRIIKIDKKTVMAEAFQWGIGWEEEDITGAVIDDRLLKSSIEIAEWMKGAADGSSHTAPNCFVPRSFSEPSVITMDSSEGCYLARGNAVSSSFPVLLEAGRVYVYVCVFLRLFFVRFALWLVDARIDDGKTLLSLRKIYIVLIW